jgi:hypothetical protein
MIIDCHAHAVPLEVANIFQKLELRSPRQGHWNEKERLDLMNIWIFSKVSLPNA